mmetsp:Transcript_101423/g.175175  ORF Transcript_101423/g.175175 Transcript_101423/m.175175 type:complete len:120 (-) Transcript_101423:122-481(-)
MQMMHQFHVMLLNHHMHPQRAQFRIVHHPFKYVHFIMIMAMVVIVRAVGMVVMAVLPKSQLSGYTGIALAIRSVTYTPGFLWNAPDLAVHHEFPNNQQDIHYQKEQEEVVHSGVMEEVH